MNRLIVPILISLFPLCSLAQTSDDSLMVVIGDLLETGFYDNDLTYFKGVFDNQAFAEKIIIDDSGNLELKAINDDFKTTDFAEAFGQRMTNEVEKGVYYNFIHYQTGEEGNYYLTFRFFGDDGINYHDYRVEKADDDSWKITDIYIYLTGEYLSQSLKNIYLAMAGDRLGERLVDSEMDSETIMTFGEINKLIQQGKMNEAREVFKTKVPEKVRDERYSLFYEVRLIDIQDTVAYSSILDKMADDAKSQVSLYLISIDLFYLAGEFERALVVIDSLYAYTQDDFLDFYVGNMEYAAGRKQKAKLTFEAMLENYPYLPDLYDNLLTLYAELNDDENLGELLDDIVEKLEISHNYIDTELMTLYPNLKASAAYKSWVEKHKDAFSAIIKSADIEELTAFQKELNEKYADPEKSPLKEKDRLNFKSLDFFPFDENFKVTAKFVRTENEEPFEMPTTTDRLPVYVKYGEVHFEIDGTPLMLNIYQNVELVKKEKYKDYLFLPFTDETNGVESYGGGRYIDLKIPEGNTVILDFNESYNPYCAYNDKYSCPIPPVENHLKVQIKAGVMGFEKH